MLEILSQYAPLIGLVFFLSIFASIAIWALCPSNKQKLEAYGKIPLQEEHKNGR